MDKWSKELNIFSGEECQTFHACGSAPVTGGRRRRVHWRGCQAPGGCLLNADHTTFWLARGPGRGHVLIRHGRGGASSLQFEPKPSSRWGVSFVFELRSQRSWSGD